MTREELLELARQAGIEVHERKQQARIGIDLLTGNDSTEKLLKFVEVVAASERRKHQADIERWKGEAEKAEKWRALALSKDPAAAGRIVQEIQREAAEHEREECAQICDELPIPGELLSNGGWEWESGAIACSTAIRARGNQ